MSQKSSLRSQIFLGLGAYLVILTTTLLWVGNTIHEAAEHQAWGTMLRTELANHRERQRSDPDYRWKDTGSLALQHALLGSDALPFNDLAPGLYDDLRFGDQLRAALIEHEGGERWIISVDITRFESLERDGEIVVLGLTIAAVLALLLALGWGVSHLVRPLRRLRDDITQMEPTDLGQRLQTDRYPLSDVAEVAERFNRFLQTNQALMERERRFIETSSHELRTPVAAITGAAELALEQPGLPAAAIRHLDRIHQCAIGMEQLITLLLTLARSPERVAELAERVSLQQLIPGVIEDHRYLLEGRMLDIQAGPFAAFELLTPPLIVTSVIGNLLRNAIEHSDRGTVRLTLDGNGEVRIVDPGHRRSPEEVSALFAQQARDSRRLRSGIGLELVSRLCQHMDWELRFEKSPDDGTTAILQLSASRFRPTPEPR